VNSVPESLTCRHSKQAKSWPAQSPTDIAKMQACSHSQHDQQIHRAQMLKDGWRPRGRKKACTGDKETDDTPGCDCQTQDEIPKTSQKCSQSKNHQLSSKSQHQDRVSVITCRSCERASHERTISLSVSIPYDLLHDFG